VDRSSAQGALVETPKAPRWVGSREGVPPPLVEGFGDGDRLPPQKFFLLFYLKVKHFGAVFKLDLTEETSTQLQEEAI